MPLAITSREPSGLNEATSAASGSDQVCTGSGSPAEDRSDADSRVASRRRYRRARFWWRSVSTNQGKESATSPSRSRIVAGEQVLPDHSQPCGAAGGADRFEGENRPHRQQNQQCVNSRRETGNPRVATGPRAPALVSAMTGRARIGLTLQEPVQVGGEFTRGRVATGGLLGHRFQADRFQVARNRINQASGRTWLIIQDLVNEHPLVAPKRQLAAQQQIENYTQTVDVAAAVDFVAFARAPARGSCRPECPEFLPRS